MASDKINFPNFNLAIFKQVIIGLTLFICLIVFLDANFSPVKSNAEFINDFEGHRSANGREHIFTAQTNHEKYRISAQIFNEIDKKDSLLIYRSKITSFIHYYGLRKHNQIIISRASFLSEEFFGLVSSILGILIAIILYFNKKAMQNVTLQGILVFLIIISLIFLRNYLSRNYLFDI